MSCDFGKIIMFFIFILFGLPVPLIATHLLLVSLLSNIYSSYVFGMESKDNDITIKNQEKSTESLVSKSMMNSVGIRSVFVTVSSAGAFFYGFYIINDYIVAMSMCFITLAACEFLVIFPSRSGSFTGLGRKLFGNMFLNVSVLLSFAILMAVMYVPVLNDLFSTVPLSGEQILVCAGMCVVSVFGFEISKLAMRGKE